MENIIINRGKKRFISFANLTEKKKVISIILLAPFCQNVTNFLILLLYLIMCLSSFVKIRENRFDREGPSLIVNVSYNRLRPPITGASAIPFDLRTPPFAEHQSTPLRKPFANPHQNTRATYASKGRHYQPYLLGRILNSEPPVTATDAAAPGHAPAKPETLRRRNKGDAKALIG